MCPKIKFTHNLLLFREKTIPASIRRGKIQSFFTAIGQLDQALNQRSTAKKTQISRMKNSRMSNRCTTFDSTPRTQRISDALLQKDQTLALNPLQKRDFEMAALIWIFANRTFQVVILLGENGSESGGVCDWNEPTTTACSWSLFSIDLWSCSISLR